MQRFGIAATLVIAALFSFTARAQDHENAPGVSPYAGYQARTIKSLSGDDIAELTRGGGWGLALPAELSGKPGPKHLLQLKAELDLSPEQVNRLEKLYAEMRQAAVAAGKRFIEAEAALSDALARHDLDSQSLRALVEEAESRRADLRFIHLSRHLLTPDLLTDRQITRYNALRGYSDAPCQAVPSGHDPDLWRKHGRCE